MRSILQNDILWQSFLSIQSNKDYVEQNTMIFRRKYREKSQKSRTNHCMCVIINHMSDICDSVDYINPIVNLARTFNNNPDSETYYSNDTSYEYDN